MGFSHSEILSPSRSDDEQNKTILSPEKSENDILPSHISMSPRQRKEDSTSIIVNNISAPAPAAPVPTAMPRSTPPAPLQPCDEKTAVSDCTSEGRVTNQLMRVPTDVKSKSAGSGNVDKEKTTFADMAKNGKWELVGSRKRPKTKNRFIGKPGVATTDSNCKFRAAEPRIPILITNVHKDTLQSDIVDYIREKTSVSVELQQITMKDNNNLHNAFKCYVPSCKLDLFLTDHLWPAGIIIISPFCAEKT
jgi:hypothetical protein